MGLFGLFKKKKEPVPALPHAYPSGDQAFMEPIEPLAQLQPQPMDRPSSLSESEMHTILTKLDLISARLENISQRIANLEQGMHQGNQQPMRQAAQPRQLPRW